MKSDEKDMFEKRQKDIERHQKIYGESDKERIMWGTKGKSNLTRKMLSQSMDYKDLIIPSVKKVKPAFHESNDTPLGGVGNKEEKQEKAFPVMNRKSTRGSMKELVIEKSNNETKLLQDKKRSQGNLSLQMRHCDKEQKLL